MGSSGDSMRATRVPGWRSPKVAGGEGRLRFGDGEQGWVELDEGGVYGGVLGVAGVAGSRGWNHFGGFDLVEAEEGPVAGEARVFDVDFKAHDLSALEVAFLIDGAFAFGPADFKDEHGFVGPGARREEGFVGLGVDEDVVEHVMVGHTCHGGRGVVADVEAGGEVDPFAIVFGRTS